MKKLMIGMLAATFTCGTGILVGQQQNPNPSNPPQNSQDVPQQQPGSNNPDLQQRKKPAAKKAPQQSPSASNPSQKDADVPQQQPGTKSPDLKQQHATQSDTSGTQHRAKKRHNQGRRSSSGGQTQSTSQS